MNSISTSTFTCIMYLPVKTNYKRKKFLCGHVQYIATCYKTKQHFRP